ncbi:hypothetical protein [Leuconostoc falkenbergense]|uniref:hypothetical protein n=1 Tax=Leuconostoc falkenbergense TaxID=2766470 RepID=UPI0024A85801|nr:hypothetical protein [Leuconostoc falkenbergense]MDI6553116.1 hypothetical protein [Leuconostoc falkenbergense]
MAGRFYSEKEVSTIKSMYANGCSDEEIAKTLNRSIVAIKRKRQRLDLALRFVEKKNWENWETEYLKQNYGKLDITDMMDHLGRSYNSIVIKAAKNNLRTKKRCSLDERKKQADDIQELADQGYYASEISKMLKINDKTVYSRIIEFGLTIIDGHDTERYHLKMEKTSKIFWSKRRG